MNPELDSALSDIGGKTGLRIIRAIAAGERDGARLAKLRDRRAEAEEGAIAAAPAGNRRAEHLPSLELARESCRRRSGRIERLEQSILAAAERLAGEGEKPGWERRMREAMRRAFGVDLAAVPSIAAEAMPAVFSAVGPDFSMLPGESRFCQRSRPARAHRLRDGGARQAMQRRAGAAVRGPPAVPPGQAAGVRRARQGWRHGPIGTGACADLKAMPESFSFCKDFSGGKCALVEVFIIRLHGRCLPERLMRAIGVVEALEFGQLDVQRAHAQLAVVELVELVAAGRVGALHAAVIFGASGRQHEQGDAAPLAGGLELGHELAAAVDLHRLDIERRLADQMVQELRGAGGGGARVGAHIAKLRDRAHRLELLDAEAGLDGDAHVVDLHHLAGLSPAGAVAPAAGVAVELAPPGLCSPVVERGGLGPAGAHQAGDHAPGGGLAGREAVLAQAPLPAAGHRPGAADRLQGGRFGRSWSNSASVSKRSAACGESSSRIASRR